VLHEHTCVTIPPEDLQRIKQIAQRLLLLLHQIPLSGGPLPDRAPWTTEDVDSLCRAFRNSRWPLADKAELARDGLRTIDLYIRGQSNHSSPPGSGLDEFRAAHIQAFEALSALVEAEASPSKGTGIGIVGRIMRLLGVGTH
jgi:hypothetical protein